MLHSFENKTPVSPRVCNLKALLNVIYIYSFITYTTEGAHISIINTIVHNFTFYILRLTCLVGAVHPNYHQRPSHKKVCTSNAVWTHLLRRVLWFRLGPQAGKSLIDRQFFGGELKLNSIHL